MVSEVLSDSVHFIHKPAFKSTRKPRINSRSQLLARRVNHDPLDLVSFIWKVKLSKVLGKFNFPRLGWDGTEGGDNLECTNEATAIARVQCSRPTRIALHNLRIQFFCREFLELIAKCRVRIDSRREAV